MSRTALEILLGEVHRIIPRELLQATFGRNGVCNPRGYRSIDQCLYEQVWRPITLAHINLTVGRAKTLIVHQRWRLFTRPIDDSVMSQSGYLTGYYRIPPEAREFADIVAVERLDGNLPSTGTGLGAISNTFGGIGNTVSNMNAAALEMRTHRFYAPPPDVTLISSNTIEVQPDQVYNTQYYLHCILSYNLEFTNADPVIIEPARRLFLSDVKAFIYTHLDIKTDTTAVVGGMEIGRFRDRLSEYSTAEAEREEFLTTVRGQAYNDPKSQTRLIAYTV